MNEKTWERVAEWEQLHCAECPDPRLLRFRGRPDDLRSAPAPAAQSILPTDAVHVTPSQHQSRCSSRESLVPQHGQGARFVLRSPLARVGGWLGGQLPFDRHDWWVDRCGREVRYVIDFYYNEELGGTPNVSGDPDAAVRVRMPALLPFVPYCASQFEELLPSFQIQSFDL
jgi:cytochrome c heme-lyase